ncbi:MAG: hypothetical protein ABI255_12820 [Microbacteriaceae bacterium]
MRFSFRGRARSRRAAISTTFAIVAGMLLLPAAPATALDSEVDANGFAWVIVPSVVDASELWVEVEAPTLTAENTMLMVDGTETALRSTALGAGAIIPYNGKSIRVAVGVAVTASPDVAITLLDGSGAALFSDHSRIALTPTLTPSPSPSPGNGAVAPGGSGPAGVGPGSTPGGDPSRAGKRVNERGGVLSDTGTDVVGYLVLAILAVALGAAGIAAGRRRAGR